MVNTHNAAADINSRIAAAEKELTMRQAAARHLLGIPARQNANTIERLYDALCALNIERIEGSR